MQDAPPSARSSVASPACDDGTPEHDAARAVPANRRSRWPVLLSAVLPCLPSTAHASIFEGETLDMVANVMSWVVLVVVPVVVIIVFWLVHILPEKIAHKRKHPQTKAIQTLCLLSLFFGGMLWPLAWLWAYSKPVLYKMAYGTDVDETDGHGAKHAEKTDAPDAELARLRRRVAELEASARDAGSEGRKS